jgi:hypothetical protein
MNLLEIILTLHGKTATEQKLLLIEWGVDKALWGHIQHCFTDEGRFTRSGREAYEKFYIELAMNYKM